MLSSVIRTRLKGGSGRQRQGEQVGEKQSAAPGLLGKPSGRARLGPRSRTPSLGERQRLQRLERELPGICLGERGAGTLQAGGSSPGKQSPKGDCLLMRPK